MLKHPGLLVIAALLCGAAASAQSVVLDEPIASGYVTRVDATGFYMDGDLVQITPETELYVMDGKKKSAVETLPPPYVGEPMEIWGRFRDRKSKILIASVVHAVPPAEAVVTGVGMILELEPGGAPDDKTVHADGYRLHLTSKTTLDLEDQARTLAETTTNCWIAYHGTQKLDGTVEVDEAKIVANILSSDDKRAIERTTFEPGEVTEADRQGKVNQFVLGFNRMKLPASHDLPLQARVNRIGESLIPKYQRDLDPKDPTRIDFRFQLVDTDKVRDTITFPNGTILLPSLVATRLTDDAQLAEVLADGIAMVIEKQEVFDAGVRTALSTVHWVRVASILALSTAGFALSALTKASAGRVLRHEQEQSGRVSLMLLHAAGYDLKQAPVAWWLESSKDPKPLDQLSVPDRANNLYAALGTTWRGRLD